jgi:FKBP-type peptidyl-prolyl cis-trans isomerase FklB
MTAIKNPVQRMLRLLPLCLAALSLLLTSCKEQDDTVEEFPNWQHQNDVFYGRLVADAREFKASGDLHWDLIPSYSKPTSGYAYQYYDYVVVEKLEEAPAPHRPCRRIPCRYTTSAS